MNRKTQGSPPPEPQEFCHLWWGGGGGDGVGTDGPEREIEGAEVTPLLL